MCAAKVHPTNVKTLCKSRVFEDYVSGMWDEVKTKEAMSFHKAMRWTLLLLQVFLLFPVNEVTSRTPSSLRINYTSPLYIMNTILLVFSSICVILVLRLALILGLGLKSTSAFAFSIVTLCAGFTMRHLAMRWPRLMLFWKKHEDVFLRYPYREPKHNLNVVLTSSTAAMFLMVLVGHCLALGKSASENSANILICNLTDKVEFLTHMYHRERPEIFNVIPFQNWMAPFLELSRFILSLYWTFIDVMIVHVSIGLTVRFEQLGSRIVDNRYSSSQEIWHDIRIHYGQLADLVLEVDQKMANIILLSCANNMYFICYNTFKSFTPMVDTAGVVQFWYDLLLTIFKTALVLFSASRINETVNGLSNSIRQVPSHCWNIEAERLVEQVESQQVALTGWNLFRLTRTLILGFSGTIVTLEIVMLDHRDKYEGNNLFKCNLSF